MNLDKLKLSEKRLKICQKLGFENSEDILNYYPYRYEEINITPYKDFVEGCKVAFSGELLNYPSTFRYAGNRSITRFKVLYDEEELNISIFNRPWINGLRINSKIFIVGKYEGKNKVTASNFYTKDPESVLGIHPIYPLKEGITQNDIIKLIEYTFKKCDDDIKDDLPTYFVKRHHLIVYKDALNYIHKPNNKNELKLALARLKYEEFLRFYLVLECLKDDTVGIVKQKKSFDSAKVSSFVKSLGFELTIDQKETTAMILKDILSEKPMYRLVQGEVGSGKTAVAQVALYANYLSGYQGAIMAPTEILAKQHYESFIKVFKDIDLNIALLYSGMPEIKKVKKTIIEGKADIVIGTHALFSEDVSFKKLGMVIADEQHRFGVKQRKALKTKGKNVDFLLMSATPIPRTLASAVYGNMDISSIKTLPNGRKGCDTYLIRKNSLVDVIDKIIIELKQGRQAYIVASAIEASDNYAGKDANGLYKALSAKLKPFKVALLHGKLSSDEKDLIMKDFENGKTSVLVSTTVIEVGVNVKNATIMVIYDADRFGLSQLHQLRGRVQRGNYKGTCYLLSNTKDEDALKRLKVLCDSNDGFKIAYEDLKLRGPGDILGTRQSGIPSLTLGDIVEDNKFIEAAKEDVKIIISDPKYSDYYQKIRTLAASRTID